MIRPDSALDNRERAFGFERAIEKCLKDFALVAIAFRMLFPNQRVARRRKQRVEVLAAGAGAIR